MWQTFQNFITIEGKDRITNTEILDLTGRTIATGIKFENNRINIENLASGIYLLKIITDNESTTKKFTKE